MRNAGRLKLGYYPLPVEEARNLRNLLIAPQPFFAVDPCAGDGTALLEITRDFRPRKRPLNWMQTEPPPRRHAASRPRTAAPSNRIFRQAAARSCISTRRTTWRWADTATSDWNLCSSTTATDGLRRLEC